MSVYIEDFLRILVRAAVAISMQPLTEDAQKYLLAFIHLGVITSYHRRVLMFYEQIRSLTNYIFKFLSTYSSSGIEGASSSS